MYDKLWYDCWCCCRSIVTLTVVVVDDDDDDDNANDDEDNSCVMMILFESHTFQLNMKEEVCKDYTKLLSFTKILKSSKHVVNH